MKCNRFIATVSTAALLLGAGACASTSTGTNVTLQYWLWDNTQAPLYEACANDFHSKNPTISVNITQTAWNQYWQNLTTQIAAASAPDVFTDHVSYFQQYVANSQILDITPYLEKSNIDLKSFQPGLADLWKLNGKRYGLPKDWDTVALVYDTKVAQEAGYDANAMNTLNWNPQNGGTFEEFIRKVTVDEQGRNALDPSFDKNHVKRYGYYPEWADGAVGQNGWGNFAASNGFTYSDGRGVANSYHFDSPKLVETAAWLQHLIAEGLAPKFDQQSTLGTDAIMKNGNSASTVVGSSTASTYLDSGLAGRFAYAMLPEGPQGRKVAMNGLSDAIWSGTQHPEEAWKWVAYLASSDCQDKVAESGIIFPAQKSATKIAIDARSKKGWNSMAFTTPVEKEETFTLPIFPNSSETGTIVQDALQAIAQGGDPTQELTKANEAVEKLATKN
ncbi:ABC transporter substrate-binding protein [Bifidobacterium sp.]|jgi:multiple sugar transport system substrate-binding protein|uniref:ABC transporter substrate-binding protein n=1 Tax=Bifidobacterium sp. TaxID=41200 RepID=UPI0025B8591E|nr:sugar ABC transporter substrate-binding protein [Bifidobacterium sp.]MCH4209109.1 sugar ABC transporter substrate-binding protein [Bifidobacterium sp.]MCI1224710.1 sugar ABC transporter substrate-binding protein [Bifidobacterium sp.]